jgi:L-methionine (R)-S-oxide reductase
MTAEFEQIVRDVRAHPASGYDLRLYAMQRLDGLDGYDWSGIYRLEGDTLVLDAYVGAATDHDRIPVGRGVCGTAVATGRTQVVEDVRALDNYLACSLETRAEIVVLVRKDGEVVGQIDIDSHQLGRFGPDDEVGLTALAEALAERW